MPHTYTNDIVTFYEDADPPGAGPFPLVVLIHGHSIDLRMWKRQVRPLIDAGFRVVRYDVRGHGRSMVTPSGYTWDNYSQDLTDLLDRLNIDRPVTEGLAAGPAHIVGLSMGGAVALKFTLDHPQRVKSLTLVDSTLPGFTYSEEFSNSIVRLREAVRAEGVQAAFEQHWFTHPIFDGVKRFPERFAELHEMASAYQAADYFESAAAPSYVPPDHASRLHEVTAPTLVIVGADDVPDFRLIAEIMASTIPNARLEVMPACGHIPPMEDPDAFNQLLISFLRDHLA